MRIVPTGRAGLIGSALSRYLKHSLAGSSVVAFDNLKRSGSGLNLDPLRHFGIEFFTEIFAAPAINRQAGQSKPVVREMASRYLFRVLYCLMEKWLSKLDYHRQTVGRAPMSRIRRHPQKSWMPDLKSQGRDIAKDAAYRRLELR